MKPTRRRFGIVLLAMLASGPPIWALSLYVAPEGDDHWSGRFAQANAALSDGPVASLAGARDRIRALSPLSEPVTVLIANATYLMTEPLVLEPRDSGTEKFPVAYKAEPGAHPVFSGGRMIAGWEQAGWGTWSAHVPEVRDGRWYFEQLWVNGVRAVRARTSGNDSLIRAQQSLLIPIEQSVAGSQPKLLRHARQLLFMGPSVLHPLAKLDYPVLRDVQIVIYHKWDVTRRFIDAISPDAGIVIVSGAPMEPSNPLTQGDPFYFENFRPALDGPGKWFLNRDGTLLYRPRQGENMHEAQVVAPLADALVVVRGDPVEHRYVSYVSIEGLIFEYSQWLTPPSGVGPSFSALNLGGVIDVSGAHHVAIEGCEVTHTGIYAVSFGAGCRDDTLKHCYLHDLGAGGVKIRETRSAIPDSERTQGIVVDNNIVAHGGRYFACAVGISVGESPNNQLTHNDIGDFSYSGILLGNIPGYGPGLTGGNRVNFNHIHDIGHGTLGDLGGIYCEGVSPGATCSNNVIHDVKGGGYGGYGLYADEGTSYVTFENNLVYSTDDAGFDQHTGQENIVRNNIFALGTSAQLQRTNAEGHLSFTLTQNIVYWVEGTLLAGNWHDPRMAIDRNLYFNPHLSEVEFGERSLAQWREMGYDRNSLIADPLFVNPSKFDFRLRPGSPAEKIGFRPFDPAQAGVYGDPAWIALARHG